MNNPPAEPIGMSVTAAVVKSGSSRTALYLAMKSGALRAKKLGKRRIILDEDLRAWLRELPDAPTPSK